MTFLVKLLQLVLRLHFQENKIDFLEHDRTNLCMRVSEVSVYPDVLNEGRETTFRFSVKFDTWNTSTFSKVNNWDSKIWLGMTCRFAVRIRNFHFALWGHMRDEQWHFLSYTACQWNSIYFQRVDKW